ncbi:hypothetical protein CN186_22750 [Sinorhizobium medicae]|uniref:hypothetical protein n=1 Tax=Sinorhizobium medicae TaxID=110321 RepID=UPI000FD7CD81|nr:hypothetical protein [Sinorhizobium medicae]RVI90775.1 hypothetical protein CN186_22750 [Sinorhizobium medicae]
MKFWCRTITLIALVASASGASSQQQAPPPIPKDSDSQALKVESCRASISDQLGWQLGDAKRLREWCRDHGFITYKQQLEAEKLVR